MLYNPNFNKYFLLYTFASDTSLVVVPTQKDELNKECPISFMSASLQGPQLNYPIVGKKEYAVYKVVRHLKPYLFKNHCIVFVPAPAVKSLLVQQDLGERRVNWMAGLQEYDLDIKPVHTINGHGLCRLVAEAVHAQEEEEELTSWEQEIDLYNVERASPTSHNNSWYEEVC